MKTHLRNLKSDLMALLLLGAGMGLPSCGLKTTESAKQSWTDGFRQERIRYSKSESGQVLPERVARFLADAHVFGTGVRTYSLGSYQKTVTDCSGFIGQAHRLSGYGVLTFQFDYDPLNFTSCTGGLKPGDAVLLAYPGRQPDHWVLMADVKSPQGKFNSAGNVIMDVSSDYVDGRPYYKGELGRRRNLMARQVYACRRHRAFARDWKELERQLQEDARAAAEKEKTGTEQSVCPTPAGHLETTTAAPTQGSGCSVPSVGGQPFLSPTGTPTPSAPSTPSAPRGTMQVF
ncbi:MAG: hypothetical protein RIR26_1616 [Pseudomonadota bacterium]|jgi:hypothetical protein